MTTRPRLTRKVRKNATTALTFAVIADATDRFHSFIDWSEQCAALLGVSVSGLDRAGTIAALRAWLQ